MWVWERDYKETTIKWCKDMGLLSSAKRVMPAALALQRNRWRLLAMELGKDSQTAAAEGLVGLNGAWSGINP